MTVPQHQGAASPAQEPALKPCAFCGEPDGRVLGEPGIWWVQCASCEAEGPGGSSERTDAIAAWNTRPVQPAAAPVGELRDQSLSGGGGTVSPPGELASLGDPLGSVSGQTEPVIGFNALAAAPVTGDRGVLNPVERIETVPMEHPFSDEETPPVWRVSITLGGNTYCADFDFEEAAENWRKAILSLAPVTGDRETAGVETRGTSLTEAVVKRDGYHLDVSWFRQGVPQTARVYDAHQMPLSPALADVLVAALEWQPAKPRATPPSGGGDHAGGEAALSRDQIIALLKKHVPHTPIVGVSAADVFGRAADAILIASPNARTTAAPASDDLHYTGCPWKDGGPCDCHEGEPLAASPKAQGSDVGLREALKRIERWAAEASTSTDSPRAYFRSILSVSRSALAASRTGQKGAGS